MYIINNILNSYLMVLMESFCSQEQLPHPLRMTMAITTKELFIRRSVHLFINNAIGQKRFGEENV
jgi:hypothetical protein